MGVVLRLDPQRALMCYNVLNIVHMMHTEPTEAKISSGFSKLYKTYCWISVTVFFTDKFTISEKHQTNREIMLGIHAKYNMIDRPWIMIIQGRKDYISQGKKKKCVNESVRMTYVVRNIDVWYMYQPIP